MTCHLRPRTVAARFDVGRSRANAPTRLDYSRGVENYRISRSIFSREVEKEAEKEKEKEEERKRNFSHPLNRPRYRYSHSSGYYFGDSSLANCNTAISNRFFFFFFFLPLPFFDLFRTVLKDFQKKRSRFSPTKLNFRNDRHYRHGRSFLDSPTSTERSNAFD